MPTKQAMEQTIRVGRGFLHDVVMRPKARTLDDVPAFATAITPEWMTLAICADTGVRVTDVRHESVSNGSTCRGLLHLTYSGPADRVASMPATVFVKSTSSFLTRLQVGAMGGTKGEIRFYEEILPTSDIVAPRGYFGLSDRKSGRSVLLLEDLTRTRHVTFCHNEKTYVDQTMAERMVDSLAVVHGTLYDSERFTSDLKWMITSETMQQASNAYIAFDERCRTGFDRAGDAIPVALRGRRDDIQGGLMAGLALDAGRPLGLMHSDVHMGNWYVDQDGRMGLYDWSAIVRGQGARDLVYALMSALTVDDRRAWERELVERYADRLGAVTGSTQDAESMWTSYRQQTLHGLTYWLYTLGAGRLQPAMQTDSVSTRNIERMSQAVVDLDTFAALGR